MCCRCCPCTAMQRFGIEQEAIEIEQTGGGTDADAHGFQSSPSGLADGLQRVRGGWPRPSYPDQRAGRQAPAVTDTKTTIESVLQEGRVFDPPAAMASQARIGSLDAYRQLADAARL